MPKLRTPRTAKKEREAALLAERQAAQARFLAAFRLSANVYAACEQSQVGRSSVYDWRAADPAFAEAWKDAEAQAVETLEVAAWRRARDGVKRTKAIYYKGKEIGTETETEYSDTLLIFLLKAHKPDKYRETVRNEHTGKDGLPIEGHTTITVVYADPEPTP